MTPTAENSPAIIEPLVLVVDDDPTVLAALSALLAPRLEPLYRVETLASAEEALEFVARPGKDATAAPVALVISDERMPGRSGTDLLIALKQNAAHRDGGRIVITAYAGLESAKRAINEAEVDRYYPKPWNSEESLLPAVASILGRFARKRGLDRLLLVRQALGADDLAAVRQVRREWWGYLNFESSGVSVEEAGVEVPTFADPEDEGAALFLAERLSPREKQPAGSIRLRRAGDAWILDALAFWPEEASDALETLLLRTALLHAAGAGAERVQVEAPVLRREVYEGLGFTGAGTAAGASGTGAPQSHTVTMQMDVRGLVAPAGSATRGAARAGVNESAAFASRYASERRLCACQQTACAGRDYAAARRGYFCPLDVLEGRLPSGFPRAT